MPNVNKYKSVGITVETYEKLVLIAQAQNRNLCQQFKMRSSKASMASCGTNV